MSCTADDDADQSAEDRLRRIQLVTDAALTHLDVDDLLNELLDRVRDLLDADTAAVLILDEEAGELVARAARGIEEEVRAGVRVPVGAGFAGRVAAERRPVVLDRVDETTVANRLLWEKGIRAMLGVPLLSGGQVIGVLHVGTLGDRRFTEHDVELCRLVADRVAGATQARLLSLERAAGRVLQRSLLPMALPSCPGLEFAARYAPAEAAGVGGDWYDVFTPPSGEVWAVAGDVTGHGLRAAVVMGRLRSTIRSYALLGGPPEEVLNMTDRKLQHFEPGEMATVACAVLTPPYDTVRVSLAGHPPPLLAAGGAPAGFMDIDPDPPLGAGVFDRAATPAALPPGGVVVLYTDGLVERRYDSLDERFERLRGAVSADRPSVVCRTVMERMLGDDAAEDDVAMLVLRRAPAASQRHTAASRPRWRADSRPAARSERNAAPKVSRGSR